MLWWHAPNIISLFFSFSVLPTIISLIFCDVFLIFGGERKHSHFPKLKSEKVKILTSPSIFADVGTKITVMENILHAFSLDKTEPETGYLELYKNSHTLSGFHMRQLPKLLSRKNCFQSFSPLQGITKNNNEMIKNNKKQQPNNNMESCMIHTTCNNKLLPLNTIH